MTLETHQKYMHRCLELAAKGLGQTAPNPLVGSVIVHNEVIIGEGYHHKFGEAHAEVNAIASVKDQSLLSESTLYVNLEPCSHFGKTPPCADLIISKQIKRVVIGMQDPFAKVNGEGIKKLREAGIDVIVDVLKEECEELNKRFITFHTENRPYIILKWAQSFDGYMGREGENVRISNEESRMLNFQWRTEEDAVLVGSGTVIIDNPQLNVRDYPGRNPARIILDRSGRLSENLNIFDGSSRTIIVTTDKIKQYKNAEVIKVNAETFIEDTLKNLHQLQIQSVIVEGGKNILDLFIKHDLWDEARVFVGNNELYNGIPAPIIKTENKFQTNIGDNYLFTIFNQN
jgi:diaminohydroxyphosphoribosylaminopyrimidine deaminase / 5-amino-6-(5-phosphoribosylamino)uracil reductase